MIIMMIQAEKKHAEKTHNVIYSLSYIIVYLAYHSISSTSTCINEEDHDICVHFYTLNNM